MSVQSTSISRGALCPLSPAAPNTLCCPARSGGQRSHRRARNMVGGTHARRPLPRVPRFAPPLRGARLVSLNPRRLTRGRCFPLAMRGRPLLLATPGDTRASCRTRTPCSKPPCLPGWAEIEQERAGIDLTFSRGSPLSLRVLHRQLCWIGDDMCMWGLPLCNVAVGAYPFNP
uniref:Predicted protein n=1 Tax=Hordeum vulgare subsp. vulgare TaxID=112509 RepID=F2EKM0_HORVV|nr:predicted protein [Hordeum vulgare subsp. vulgare]